ncbi:hypothetical protein [Thalassotalea sediminis]|uniref:hypothetical protein n=1 Tax=Thalassotalea sediminis TaxID=1759089 RepID=UPI00257370FD|nr:hypothetical protein [Thalassotalea sediminis]
MNKYISVILLLFFTVNVNAACNDAEYREFDFWLGNWQVTTQTDTIVRHNTVVSINQGCTLLEQYSTPDGFTGKSLNIYDRKNKRWHQTWVDSQGNLLLLSGGMQQDSMVMTGTTSEKGNQVLNRITWTPLKGGKVRQLWQSSQDNGSTWVTVFDGLYEAVTQK